MIAVSVCVLTACSSGNEASEPVPTTLAPAPTNLAMATTTAAPATVTTTALATTTTIDEKAAVLAAYVEYRAAVKQLLRQPDLSSPALTDLMTNVQRELIRQRLQQSIVEQYRSESPASSVARETPTVESLSAGTAVVVSCSVDDSFRRNLSDGSVANVGTVTSLLRSNLVREGGRWKVASVLTDRSWDGVAGCAV